MLANDWVFELGQYKSKVVTGTANASTTTVVSLAPSAGEQMLVLNAFCGVRIFSNISSLYYRYYRNANSIIASMQSGEVGLSYAYPILVSENENVSFELITSSGGQVIYHVQINYVIFPHEIVEVV